MLKIKLIGALTSKPFAFSARSWELESLDFIDFYDTMLSNISIDVRGLKIMRILPRINERINEEWISDKIRFSYDGFRQQRILSPTLRIGDILEELDWEEALFNYYLNYNIYNYDYINNNFLSVLGNFIDLESMFAFNQYIISNLFSSYKLYNGNGGLSDNSFVKKFLINDNINELSKIDFFFIIGSNLRYSHPILHIKILRLSNSKVPVFTFGSYSKVKFKAYSFGYSINNLLKFIEGKSKYSLLLNKSKNSLFLYGDEFIRRSDSYFFQNKLINILKNYFKHIGNLISNNSYLNALVLGLKLENFNHNNFLNNKNFILNYNFDDIDYYSISNNLKDYIVYLGHHADFGVYKADLVLPSTFLIEKKGSFFSLEGNFVNFNFLLKPGYNIRTDWRIFKSLNLYFNNISNNINFLNFKDLRLLLNNILPKNLEINGLNIDIKIKDLRLYNSPFISVYNNFYMTDQVTRNSRIMAISLFKFEESFYNFK